MPDPTTSIESSPDADYGSYYFRHDCGIPYERNEHWLNFFGKVADGIVRDLHPASVLDAGCAMGFLVEALHRRGVEAWGIDISEYAISHVHASVRDRCSVASLTDPLPRRYDLIACIEVLEHLPAEEVDGVIANLCQGTDRLLLSTTPRDYGEPTHLNVQPPESWSAALAREGFLRDLDRDLSYLTPWAALYARTEEPLPETVRRYDRAWWRLRWEVSEMRDSLLGLQRQLEKLESKEPELRPALMEEVERQREELLRLRDLLIGKDSELGLARGQLAELEDRSARITNAVDRLQARMPGFLWKGATNLRKLRSRG
jgi:SAM-dependent methyltransferase